MQYLTGLLGEQGGSIATAFFALVFVLALIVFAMWAVKIAFGTSARFTRTRARRLSIVERLPVDGRRQLLIVRRDDHEHLVMTGGGQDLVIEASIPVVRAADLEAEGASATVTRAAVPSAPAPASVRPMDPPVVPEPYLPADEPVVDPELAKPRLSGHAEPVRDALAERIRRGGPSLRHTALLRPAGNQEQTVARPSLPGDKSRGPAADSDRTPQETSDGGRSDLGRAAYFGDRDGAGES